MSISTGFSKLLERIAPTQAENYAFSLHLKTVSAAAEAALEINRTEKIGSFSRDTAVHGSSDLDLMVVLSSNERKWGQTNTSSSTTLNKVKKALAARFWSTPVRNSGSAVVLSFAAGRKTVDIVPAFYAGPYKGSFSQFANYPLFNIPDGAGGWLITSPQIHGAALAAEDARSGFKLKRTAQLAKYWASTRVNLKLHSFHGRALNRIVGDRRRTALIWANPSRTVPRDLFSKRTRHPRPAANFRNRSCFYRQRCR